MMMRAQKVSLKSLKIAYVIVKPLYLDILVHELAVAKSYGFPIRVKLEGGRVNFKVTLLERPFEKSCSTSILFRNSLFFENVKSLCLAKFQKLPSCAANMT